MYVSNDATPTPNGHEHPSANGRSVILYQQPGVLVTTVAFHAHGYQYRVADLTEIEREEHGGRLRPRRYELWAWLAGQRVRLFQCDDAREFGQVCRALTRAREHAGVA